MENKLKANCNQTKIDYLINYNSNQLSLDYRNCKYIIKYVEDVGYNGFKISKTLRNCKLIFNR